MTANRPRRGLARRRRSGAVIVEFALIVPFLAIIAFGVIDFSRAYGQVNALNSALREGGRYGSKIKNYVTTDYVTVVKAKVQQYATVYGFNGLDLTKVTVAVNHVGPQDYQYITVTVTAHPIPLPILTRYLGVPALTVTRTVAYRWECAGLTLAQCAVS